MKRLGLILLLFFNILFLTAQENSIVHPKPYFADLVMGPYLILDGTIYESVFLTGVRIGREYKSGLVIGLEYLAGNQEDLQGQLGTTHSAFGNIQYFINEYNPNRRFRYYVLGGGGFFEFKDFSADVLGVSFYLGAGFEMNITETVKGFIEPRYVNLGLLDANGTHQFGQMWGIRGRF